MRRGLPDVLSIILSIHDTKLPRRHDRTDSAHPMPLATFPKCFLDHLCVDHTMSVDDWIEISAQFDVDGLEFYWGFTPWQDPAELARIRTRVEEQGRSIPMMCYSSDFTKPDAAEREREIERQKRAIEATARLGGSYCRVLSGQRRPDISREQGLTWVAERIQQLLPYAESRDVTLILENHYKDGYWKYPEFAQKQEVFIELLDRIGPDPRLGVNYDPSNAIIAGDDPIELLEAVKDRVVTMHASDRYFEGGTLEDLRETETEPQVGYADILQHGVIGEGLNDYDAIFSILKNAGFDGWISIEDGEDPEKGVDEMNASITFIRQKMQQHGLE